MCFLYPLFEEERLLRHTGNKLTWLSTSPNTSELVNKQALESKQPSGDSLDMYAFSIKTYIFRGRVSDLELKFQGSTRLSVTAREVDIYFLEGGRRKYMMLAVRLVKNLSQWKHMEWQTAI